MASATPHAPITISSNSDFESQGWPGTGTVDDPFVIEGLFIRTEEGSCIRVYRTDVYFVIRNCVLTLGEVDNDKTNGVFLEKVFHGSVNNCSIRRVAKGVRTYRAQECKVSDNIIERTKNAIFVEKGYNCSITKNNVTGANYGIYSLKSTVLTVTVNHVLDTSIGILAEETHDSFIQGNTVGDSDWGAYLYSCADTQITSNAVFGGQVGLDIEYCSLVLVSQNEIHDTGYGVYCYSSTDCDITLNFIYANSISAVYIGKSDMCILTQNIIERNSGVGVHLQESTNCWTYGNEIGWNAKGNAQDFACAPLISSLNHWDDEVGLGNGWSDYDFGGTHLIPGDCHAADMYPSAILAAIGPGVLDIEFGTDGSLEWKASAIWPDYYEVQAEGVIIDSGDWDGKDISVGLIGLDMGTYHYSLFLNTTSGRATIDLVTVVVVDRTSPAWTTQPSDQELELGDRFDYSVEATDSFGIEKYWLNDTANFGIDSAGRITDRHVLTLGVFGFELRAYDPSDNYCTAPIQVVVKDTVKPIVFEADDITFVEGEAAPDIVWRVEDLSAVEFEVFRNETLVASGRLSGGSYTIRVPVEDLASGEYSFVLVLSDEGGNTVGDLVGVEVLEPKTKTTITTTPTVTTTTTETSTTTSDTSTGSTTELPGDASMYILPLGIGIALAVVIISMILQRRGILFSGR